LVAVALEAAAVFVEQWGASRSPDDEARKHGALALLAFVLTLLTPSVLLAHAFFATQAGDQSVRVIAMVAVIVAILAGALVGAILGAVREGSGASDAQACAAFRCACVCGGDLRRA
jgi:hypothetical protein